MIELSSKKDAFGIEYKVWFVSGELWFITCENDNVYRYYHYNATETPEHINEAILDYCWREIWDDDAEPSREELIICALDNGILADSDHRIDSIENWAMPTQAAIDLAWEHGF